MLQNGRDRKLDRDLKYPIKIVVDLLHPIPFGKPLQWLVKMVFAKPFNFFLVNQVEINFSKGNVIVLDNVIDKMHIFLIDFRYKAIESTISLHYSAHSWCNFNYM